MSVDNHLGLPEEVFETILLLLALEDVLSCSLVCLGWRNAVNSDRIWEKLCRKNISEDRLKLRTTERKRVGSSYKVFESENLPMLCVWRKRYMDDVDLKRNWKKGYFRRDSVYGFDSIPDVQLETDNELLLVPLNPISRPTSYTVFIIVDRPIMTGVIHLALKPYPHYKPELFKLSNNILVIVQRTLLQVYFKDEDKNLKLKFLALFDRDHLETIPDTRDLTNWYEQIGYPGNIEYVRCDHNGKYFVGMCSRYDAGAQYSPLYIWDLEFQTQIQEVALPMQVPEEQFQRATFFLRDNTIHIIMIYESSTLIYAYDVEKFSYSETVLQLEGCFECKLLTGTVAVMESLSKERLLLFDLRDGRMLDTLENGRRLLGRRVQAFGNLITYAELTYPGDPPTVTVYDTEKLLQVDKFPVQRRYGSSEIRIHIVMDDIMLFTTPGVLHIRDLKTREILRTFKCVDFHPPDPSCSKMVVLTQSCELVVLHFW